MKDKASEKSVWLRTSSRDKINRPCWPIDFLKNEFWPYSVYCHVGWSPQDLLRFLWAWADASVIDALHGVKNTVSTWASTPWFTFFRVEHDGNLGSSSLRGAAGIKGVVARRAMKRQSKNIQTARNVRCQNGKRTSWNTDESFAGFKQSRFGKNTAEI